MSKASEILACNLIDFVSFESNKLSYGERSLGSTEVIESLFGFYKYTKAGLWDSCCGIGRLILLMASRVGKILEDYVKNALEAVRIQDVKNWLSRSLVHV